MSVPIFRCLLALRRNHSVVKKERVARDLNNKHYRKRGDLQIGHVYLRVSRTFLNVMNDEYKHASRRVGDNFRRVISTVRERFGPLVNIAFLLTCVCSIVSLYPRERHCGATRSRNDEFGSPDGKYEMSGRALQYVSVWSNLLYWGFPILYNWYVTYFLKIRKMIHWERRQKT